MKGVKDNVIVKKKVTVHFIFSDIEYDLGIITDAYVRRDLASTGMMRQGEEPEVFIHPIEEFKEAQLKTRTIDNTSVA